MLPKEKTPVKTALSDQIVLVYGLPKIGKSTWCSKAEGAVFLATEPGLGSLEVYQVPITTWEELLEACAELAQGKHPFKTVVVDTIDNAHKMCAEYICRKFKVDHEGDLPHAKGYGLVNNELSRVLRKLAFLSSGLFLTSHAREKEIETPIKKYMRISPSLPDSARKIIAGMADMILYCDVETSADGDGKVVSRRVMRTKPSIYYEAGDRTGRLPETLPLDFEAFTKAFEGGSGTGKIESKAKATK